MISYFVQDYAFEDENSDDEKVANYFNLIGQSVMANAVVIRESKLRQFDSYKINDYMDNMKIMDEIQEQTRQIRDYNNILKQLH